MKKNKKSYNDNGKSTLEILEFAQNYNKWIASKLLPHITLPALEVGAGTGNITNLISEKRTPLHISEMDNHLVAHLKEKFGKEHLVHTLDIENNCISKYQEYFSSIYSVNVLEHIQDDEKALQHMYQMAKKQGNLVVLVPAKKSAYTNLDKELGHYRRYEKEELANKLVTSGFIVERIEFFNIVGLLSWFVRDKVSKDDTQLTPTQIKLFETLVPFLRITESFIKVPTGISLIAVGRKA